MLSEEHPEDVLTLLLAQQQKTLRTEIAKQQESLDKLHELQVALRRTSHFSVASIGDIAHTMENKKKLRKLRMYLILVGIPLNFIEMSTLVLWIWKGIWQPFVFCALIAIVIGVVAAWLYSKNIAYICPHCHAMFIPAFKNMLLARHTPNTRKLTCTVCGYHGFCVETYRKEENSHA